MAARPTAAEMLDREFLEIRRRLLEVAASLDRFDACDGAAAARKDFRMDQLMQAARLITDGQADRATRVQMIFSLPYDEQWRDA